MARSGTKQRELLVRTWCERKPSKDIFIDQKVEFLGEKDMEGSIHILRGGELRIACRLSMPAGSQITVDPGGVLILDNSRLHNDCGLSWSGIVVRNKKNEEGQVYKTGKVAIENTSLGL